MRFPGFILSAFVWLAVMTAMAQLGPIGRHPYVFGLLYITGFAGMLLLVRYVPENWSVTNTGTAVILLGVAGRLVFASFPVGNDVYRYVWEGAIQNLGYNPYLLAPDNPVLSEVARLELPHIWEHINHRDLSAAYPPGFMLLCRILTAIRPEPAFFKLVFMAIDAGTLLVLVRMTVHRGIHPKYVLLYAANPLVIVYIAGEGHLDAVQVFLLCLAVQQVLKGRARFGYLVLGLAVMTKFFSIVALPLLFTWKDRARVWTFFAPFLLYLPFAEAGSAVFDSLGTFAATMHYNDSITLLLRLGMGSRPAVIAAAGLLLIIFVLIYLVVHNRLRSIYLAIGSLLLFLPTLHPWYLCLIAPFTVFYPSPAWIYLQAAVCFTFPVSGIEFATGHFQEVPLLKLFEYLPFYALLLYGLKHAGMYANQPAHRAPETIAVIIPTLDEGRSVGRAIDSVKEQTGLKEIMVVDGGSKDNTCSIASKSGATVMQGPQGRGTQVAAGVNRVRSDVVMVMHADCCLEPDALHRVLSHLAANPKAVGGALGMRFSNPGWRSVLIARLNNLRTRWTGIGFGDQAQFFRSDVLQRIDGFPSIKLMEDVELSLRLKGLGALLYLEQGVTVSGRRWQAGDFGRKFNLVIGLFVRYLFERRFYGGIPDNAGQYYERYYGINEKN